VQINSMQRVAMALALVAAIGSARAFAEELEEVVVVAKPIRASQISAIEAKRNANNVADIISADAIGRFPDQNLADALGRLAGLAIERDQGQARYVSFRGSPKRYTTTAFNGIDIPGVENGRIPRFDAYPAVITGQVVANKAITADMPGESISGGARERSFPASRERSFPKTFGPWRTLADLKVAEGTGRIRNQTGV